MAGSINKVILVGNLGKDPEVRYLESGVAVANFPIATSETYKDRNTGERISQTEWHNVVLWRGLAEVAEKYLKKGSLVYIEGKLKTRSWEDQGGVKKYTTEVVGDNMTMLGARDGAEQGGAPQAAAQPQPAANNPASTAAAPADSAPTTAAPAQNMEAEEDDLPF